ncbi:MAG TPA: hypothetical protein VLD61_02820, partial [Methylomirabilota bacterium]|nr:hypothetical protein [Methylomirabilota bacterium]
MRVRVALLVLLALALVTAVRPAAARSVVVDVRSAEGRVLGRVTGQTEGPVVYFALADVARLAGATVRHLGRDDRMGVALQGRMLELRRDQTVVRVGDRTWQLSAPIRVRRGVWVVPADLLPQNLPVLLGSGSPGAMGSPVGTGSVGSAVRPSLPVAKAAPLTLRHHSYPAFTRIVVQGELAGEPAVAEEGSALRLSLPVGSDLGPRTLRSVRDGLVGQ